MLRRINYVGIPTRDQDRALTFWTETMGCIIATDRQIGEKRWIELTISGAQTGLLLLTPEGHEDRIGTFFNGSFGCDDVHYAYEKLRAPGRRVSGSSGNKAVPSRLLQGPGWQHLLPVEPLGMLTDRGRRRHGCAVLDRRLDEQGSTSAGRCGPRTARGLQICPCHTSKSVGDVGRHYPARAQRVDMLGRVRQEAGD